MKESGIEAGVLCMGSLAPSYCKPFPRHFPLHVKVFPKELCRGFWP